MAIKNSKIRKSARGQDCQVRIPGVCNFNPETTVLAHLGGGGMGAKQPDWQGAYCCSSCHDVLDGRALPEDIDDLAQSKLWLTLWHLEGVIRTQALLIERGLLEVK